MNTDLSSTEYLLSIMLVRVKILYFSFQWKLPRDMNTGLDSVKEPERTLAHVLIAKAKICHSLKVSVKNKNSTDIKAWTLQISCIFSILLVSE